ncbi:C6 zinc finger domain-containing protein [Histoplasma capsulatum G186AR]|uniref:C6 zinc finger domain-containing protein n=1 Tax=Ajellomyces capsulatus (strain G186AR / H82 / ATCC MYA-2454 / RMSCC 2432) TaxID=447093 RepID=C0NM95_AJECG|nr:C6 zinc finger domain-containing protein [Histoplasma capsulatum G186AR]EEH07746.1 C6 zinc finger domain-containing protein [Histoplasma capsulatum G186AR]
MLPVFWEVKSKTRTSPSSQPGHRLTAPVRGQFEPGWRPYNNYDGSNPEQHGETPRAPPVYIAPPRANPHGPAEVTYGRPGSITAPPHTPTEPQPPPGTYRPVNGSQEQAQHPQPPPQQAGHTPGPNKFQQPRMPYPPDGRHPNGETHGVPMYSHGDPMQPIPASQPYAPGGHMAPTPGLYETNSYFITQAGLPLANRQRRTTRAQQACDQCRSRKAKCDEGRPACSHCKESNVPCVYKDVPPQKQERSTQIIVERIDRQEETEKATREELMKQLNEMKTLLADVKSQMDAMAGSTAPRKLSHLTPSPGKVEANANFTSPNARPPETQGPAELPREADVDRAFSTVDGDETRISEEFKELQDLDAGELSIPIEHTTAAHKLLLWPSIQKLLPERIDADYVMQLEENRGPLRLYGRGEGDDSSADSPVTSPTTLEPDPTIVALGRANAWGSGFGFPSGPDTNRFSMQQHPGGLTPYGTLNVDAETVQAYYHSYLDNMHALHPFLDAVALHQMIYNFVNNYSPRKPAFSSFSPQITHVHGERMAAIPKGKRKRSADVAFEVAPEMIPENTGAPSTVIHKSLDNAIVLLVLALGSICAVKSDIPGPLNRKSGNKRIMSTSPTLPDSGSLSSFHSPNEEFFPRSAGHHRRFSGAAHSGDVWNSEDQSERNLDIIPGLAYFALASDILGDVLGGGGLKHTQACLLAALYTGQLARPFSSHAWICEASRACQILLRPRTFDRIPNGTRQKELINFAFWTCLQLESDILAELDLPASGISRFEDRFSTHAGLFISTNELQTPDPRTMIYYVAQIHLRKVLNRVHTELYKAESPDSKGPKVSWTTKVQEALSCNLEAWRTGLPDNMRWEESDPPSNNIIIARMRGKYYGCRYIIHRPLLHHALHPMSKYLPGAANSIAPSSPSNMSSSQSQASPPSAHPALLSQNMERFPNDMGPPSRPGMLPDHQQLSLKSLDSKVRKACQACIDAAIQSTIAFDGVQGRPVVTNIFGTAHAQFGNMLVLSATYMSPLSQLVDRETLRSLLNRTINFLLQSRHISPTLSKDAEILTLIRQKIFDTPTTSFSTADGDMT